MVLDVTRYYVVNVVEERTNRIGKRNTVHREMIDYDETSFITEREAIEYLEQKGYKPVTQRKATLELNEFAGWTIVDGYEFLRYL